MKLSIMVPSKYSPKPIPHAAELECEGSGTEQDPAIISPSEHLPDQFRILNSNIFIKIVDCDIGSITLINCSNVSISSCKFRVLYFQNSSKMRIKNVELNKSLIYESSELEFEGCSFKKLKLRQSRELGFVNCSIVKLKETESSDVVFKESSVQTSKEKATTYYMAYYIGVSILTVVGLIAIFIFQNIFTTLMFVFCLIFIWIMTLLSIHIQKKQVPSEN
jgi:hypothetical protein